jgi:CheY-like chemotaxis protein/anti-sigma regulatory factor (Ser/Thr protein kinase)
VRLFGARAREKGLRLGAHCDGPVPALILCDAIRLRQILINLVGNSIKFTASGYVNLVVRLGAGSAAAGHMLEVTVEDSGLGLSREDQELVFQPFTQVQTSATREFSGTGLGLSLSRRLARLLDGDIEVESESGRGSRFTLSVATGPLEGVRMCEPDEMESLLRDATELTTPARLAQLRGRALVAEDGPDNQRLVRAILTRAGLDVEVVGNGALARDRALAAAAAGEAFDVILMDMQMPVLDGYAATEQLRAAGYTQPIIALTAHAMSGDRERCIRAGCDDFATKPIARGDLLARIATALAKSPA